MRLREMQRILKRNSTALDLPNTESVPGGWVHWPGVPARRIEDTLRDLAQIPALADIASSTLDIDRERLRRPTEWLSMPAGEAGEFTKRVRAMHWEAEALERLVDLMLPEEKSTSVTVSLPRVADLDDLISVLSIVRQVFDAGTLKEQAPDADFRVEGFDVGSEHILLAVGGTGTVTLLMQLLRGAKLNLAFKAKVNASVGTLKFEGELAAQAALQAEKRIADHRKEQVQSIATSKGAEEIARLGRVFDSLVKLVERGGDVEPALTAPAEALAEYAETKKLPSGTSTDQRQLTDGGHDNDEGAAELADMELEKTD